MVDTEKQKKRGKPSLEYQAKQKLQQLDAWIAREARKQGAWAWEPNAMLTDGAAP